MTIPETIRAIQVEIQKNNPHMSVDGKAGPQTWGAIYRAIVPAKKNTPVPVVDGGAVDARSEKNIATLHPCVQPLARSLLLRAREKGWNFVITSGLRTYAEQDALFAKRPKVTNARGGDSWHNHGCAFDVTLFSGSKPVWESPLYTALGALGEDIGLEWGGRWKRMVDRPHFQITNGKSISQAKALHVQGKTIFD